MDEWDDTEDFELLVAAATVHAARRRLRAALGPLVEERHRIPTPPGSEASAVTDVLGADAARKAQVAWNRLDAGLGDRTANHHR
jgi:hypothetical protein